MSTFVFTSESVTEGHPDKLCDQISDAILDAHLRDDPQSRVACETLAATGLVVMVGEITSAARVDAVSVARNVVREIGYADRLGLGFDADSCAVLNAFTRQSPDIAQGVNAALETRRGGEKDIGAGDQGMMFGFACDDTPELMPAPIALAHQLTRRMTQQRKSGELPWMRPDGKSQVSVLYENGRPVHIKDVVISTQHDPDVSQEQIREALLNRVVPVLPQDLIDDKTVFWTNPTGRFVIGGPACDSGLTGRKIVVDTYGGFCAHGGGAFSGKDPTKVDRSAAYMARYIAKNVVAAGLAKTCRIMLAYAIGVAQPVSLLVETEGSGKISDAATAQLIRDRFDLRPAAIIERLDLRRPIYRQTAAYGHFGRSDLDLPWEKTDVAAELA